MMNTNTAHYETHTKDTHKLEIPRNHNVQVTFNVYGNKAVFSAQFLNTEYDEKLHKLDPEIYTDRRLDGKNEPLQKGELHIEILDSHGTTLAEQTHQIENLGHKIKPGYSFVPYVKFPTETNADKIHTINIYIDPTN